MNTQVLHNAKEISTLYSGPRWMLFACALQNYDWATHLSAPHGYW